MATWKSTMRTVGSTMRALEREAARAQRERERDLNRQQKMQELDFAAGAVQEYEDFMEGLLGLHKDCCPTVDWSAVVKSRGPCEPTRTDENEQAAARALATYAPGFVDRLAHREDKKRECLKSRVEEARRKDDERFEAAQAEYTAARQAWEEQRGIAERLLGGDQSAIGEAIAKRTNLQELSSLGKELGVDCDQPGSPVIGLRVNAIDVIPAESRTLLKSGKLSAKALPKGTYFGMYLDHVCSAVFRVGRETLAVLPHEGVVVTAYAELLNGRTGHMEDQPILSVALPRSTMARLNFDLISPSGALDNFIHRIDFKKTAGFQPIEPLGPSDVDMEGAGNGPAS